MNSTVKNIAEALANIALTVVIVGGLGGVIGEPVGFVLGFTSLSPFAVCSIAVVISATISYCLLRLLYGFFKIFDKSADQKQPNSKFLSVEYISSIAIGIGLSAAANAIFLAEISDIESAAVLGGIIGAITLITCFCAVEEIKKHFFSKEKYTHTIEESDKPSSTLGSADSSKIEGGDKGLVGC